MQSIDRLKQLVDTLFWLEKERTNNLKRLQELYNVLEIGKKVGHFDELFTFNAINITGLSLQHENLLEIQPKRYLQIIGIKRSQNRSKNINLRYFGKVENIEPHILKQAAEFVLRWRLEKGYLGVENYRELLNELQRKVE